LLHIVDPMLAATPFDLHSDMAPTFYIEGNPVPGEPIAREFERAAAQLTATNPRTGNVDSLIEYLADPVEMKLLHMVTGDPQRTPTFVLFGNPDYYFQPNGTPDVVESPGYAWNHGGTNKEIVTTWLGMVGPGVQRRGVDDEVWSDHTDIRPTMLLLTGLQDDYSHDGRALLEMLDDKALPHELREHGNERSFIRLARAYKAIQAPVGPLGMATLAASTKALAGDDATYASIEAQLATLGSDRDALAAKMISALENAAFHGGTLTHGETLQLVTQAEALLKRAHALAH
jgi:hypothetical protein